MGFASPKPPTPKRRPAAWLPSATSLRVSLKSKNPETRPMGSDIQDLDCFRAAILGCAEGISSC